MAEVARGILGKIDELLSVTARASSAEQLLFGDGGCRNHAWNCAVMPGETVRRQHGAEQATLSTALRSQGCWHPSRECGSDCCRGILPLHGICSFDGDSHVEYQAKQAGLYLDIG